MNERERVIIDLNTYLINQANLDITVEEKKKVYELMIEDFEKCISEVEEKGEVLFEKHSDAVNRAYEKMLKQFASNDTIVEKIRILKIMIKEINDQIEELINNSKLNVENTKNEALINAEVDEVKCRLLSKKYTFIDNFPFENSFMQDIASVLFLECNFRDIKVNEIKLKHVLFLINKIQQNSNVFDIKVLINLEKYSNMNINIVNKYNLLDSNTKSKYISIIKSLFEKLDPESNI